MYLKFTVLLLPLIFSFCDNSSRSTTDINKAVELIDMGKYYKVTFDYTMGYSPRELGQEYGRKILSIVPDFEEIGDLYLKTKFGSDSKDHSKAFSDMNIIIESVPKHFRDEFEGAASMMGGLIDSIGDGQLSFNEYCLLNLHLDIGSVSLCTGLGITGDISEDGNSRMIRSVDWPLSRIVELQSLTTYVYTKNSIAIAGCLGIHGSITGFSEYGLMTASFVLLNNTVNLNENSLPLTFAVRDVLTNATNARDAISYLRNPFAASIQVMITDIKETIVIENDVNDGTSIREYDSKLAENYSWGRDYAVPAVNSFLSDGKNTCISNPENIHRLNNLKWNLDSAMQVESDGNSAITDMELKKIFTSYSGDAPGLMSSGDIYNGWTLQMFLFNPTSKDLEFYFVERDGTQDKNPSFEKVKLFE